ncbi:hypothetical protein [Halosolutus halophilus]|uniref:hypothetical protein n=1 Tax=Halosolutus halophilus TaxID=1552990 RepID=UPI002235173D|nr:hypothetical protein [Halosolutus halophilus]
MDRLWRSLRNDGYQSQRELWKRNPDRFREQFSQRNKFFPYLLVNEITADIGRNGELLFVDSFHRLSMAKLLDLESVPVYVLVRHRKRMTNPDRVDGDSAD